MRWLYFLLVAKFYYYKLFLPVNMNAKLILKEFATAHLLFNNGGGNINTLLSGELYKQTVAIIAASFFRLPIILSGQTIGPITNKLQALVVKIALNRADLITLRDEDVSKYRLIKIGVNKPTIKDTCDDAIGLPIIDKKEVKRLILENGGNSWLEIRSTIIAIINMNGYLKAMGKKSVDEFQNELDLLTITADRLVKDFKAKILFVPTDYGKSSDDRPLLNKIKTRMEFKDKALVINKEYDAVQYKNLIGIGEIAIGVRYHFTVFATSMGVPCIALANGVYQKTKLKGIMDIFDLQYCYISEDMSKTTPDTLWSVIEKVLNKREHISEHLKKRTEALQKESMIPIKHAKSILYNESY